MHQYFLLNKPRNMVSQFVSTHDVGLLGDLKFDFPEGTHAVGRLDLDSEGLLILTTDKRVTRLLFLAEKPHERSYLVMVQNKVSEKTLALLREGIPIKIKNGEDYKATPVSVDIIDDPFLLYPHAEDHRMLYEHTWLLITLLEGKYRQVRKMVLAARHRCLRLVRLNISDMQLAALPPGEVQELNSEIFYQLLGIKHPDLP